MKSLAIIGTGISALGAAYFLKDRFDITFYEKENYLGGHTNTVSIDEDGQPIPIDTGFIVYNELTYPLLTRLFKELEVETKPTDMSFSFQHLQSGLEYSGTGFNGLFAQRRNIFNPSHMRMLLDIDRFKKQADEVLTEEIYKDYTLAEYIQEKEYGEDFLHKFLIPMSSAVWSTPHDVMMRFPAMTLIRFFKNHCFLQLEGQPQWRTCHGGSRVYRDKILNSINAKILKNNAVVSVKRLINRVEITDIKGDKQTFDKVLLASHADESLSMLIDQSPLERAILSKFAYLPNEVTLHTDSFVMPKLRRVWSSWNYRVGENGRITTVYWMNSLQKVSVKKDYFLSVNDPGLIDPSKILWKKTYTHPLYSVASQEAQKDLPQLNKNGLVYFAGAYFRYGFHEDGLMAGLDAASAIAGEELWKS